MTLQSGCHQHAGVAQHPSPSSPTRMMQAECTAFRTQPLTAVWAVFSTLARAIRRSTVLPMMACNAHLAPCVRWCFFRTQYSNAPGSSHDVIETMQCYRCRSTSENMPRAGENSRGKSGYQGNLRKPAFEKAPIQSQNCRRGTDDRIASLLRFMPSCGRFQRQIRSSSSSFWEVAQRPSCFLPVRHARARTAATEHPAQHLRAAA